MLRGCTCKGVLGLAGARDENGSRPGSSLQFLPELHERDPYIIPGPLANSGPGYKTHIYTEVKWVAEDFMDR